MRLDELTRVRGSELMSSCRLGVKRGVVRQRRTTKQTRDRLRRRDATKHGCDIHDAPRASVARALRERRASVARHASAPSICRRPRRGGVQSQVGMQASKERDAAQRSATQRIAPRRVRQTWRGRRIPWRHAATRPARGCVRCAMGAQLRAGQLEFFYATSEHVCVRAWNLPAPAAVAAAALIEIDGDSGKKRKKVARVSFDSRQLPDSCRQLPDSCRQLPTAEAEINADNSSSKA